jgi:hypothetical protein
MQKESYFIGKNDAKKGANFLSKNLLKSCQNLAKKSVKILQKISRN